MCSLDLFPFLSLHESLPQVSLFTKIITTRAFVYTNHLHLRLHVHFEHVYQHRKV